MKKPRYIYRRGGVWANTKQKMTKKNTSQPVDNRKRLSLKVRYPLVKQQKRNAYQIFFSRRTKEIKAAETGESKLGASALSSILAEEWKGLEDKSKWYQLAKEDEERYWKDVEELGYTLPDKTQGKKRPCPPFLYFAKTHAREICAEQGCKYPAALKILGARWKTMNAPERQVYVDMTEKERAEIEQRKQENSQT